MPLALREENQGRTVAVHARGWLVKEGGSLVPDIDRLIGLCGETWMRCGHDGFSSLASSLGLRPIGFGATLEASTC